MLRKLVAVTLLLAMEMPFAGQSIVPHPAHVEPFGSDEREEVSDFCHVSYAKNAETIQLISSMHRTMGLTKRLKRARYKVRQIIRGRHRTYVVVDKRKMASIRRGRRQVSTAKKRYVLTRTSFRPLFVFDPWFQSSKNHILLTRTVNDGAYRRFDAISEVGNHKMVLITRVFLDRTTGLPARVVYKMTSCGSRVPRKQVEKMFSAYTNMAGFYLPKSIDIKVKSHQHHLILSPSSVRIRFHA